MVAIAKVIRHKAKLVIFDEPTAILTEKETKILFNIIRQLKKNGISVIYISHNLEEIFEICDTVTVLKDGEVVNTVNVSDINKDMLVSMMVGREVEDIYHKEDIELGREKLEILRGEKLSGEKFQDISFSVYKGEVLGIYGLVGAGRTEIAKAIYGAEPKYSGKIYMYGKEVKISTPDDAMKFGIGYLPEDKRLQGLFMSQTVNFNVCAANYDKIVKFWLISYRKAYTYTNEYIKKLSIKVSSIFQKVENLSGGNQQKVIIARLLLKNSKVLIFDEPTTGIDVGAKAEIYRLLAELAKMGKAIIFISSYMPELLGVSDRIIVISKGKKVGEISRANFSEEKLLTMAAE
jgi:ribose transport system ATP-binding protein